MNFAGKLIKKTKIGNETLIRFVKTTLPACFAMHVRKNSEGLANLPLISAMALGSGGR